MIKLIPLILLLVAPIYAATLDIRVEPKEPVMNENFRVIFEITTEKGTDPVISFDPLNVEVVSRGETGIRTRTTYINGVLKTERSLTVVYEMSSKRYGSAFLRNIRAEINGETVTHKTYRINILQAPKAPRDVLVRAEVDKKEVFVGESILVRYYLYNKAPVTGTEIRKFPKLDKFLKRFHQEKTGAERIRYNGEIYTRRIMYTAQLFAEKSGMFEIDPIELAVQYSQRGGNPFDNFGLGSRFGRMRKVTIKSQPVEINVKALPIQNVPPSFTGLVGKHTFKLELNKNRFVVNEPIELKLNVAGPGALELFEAPKIFTNPAIEEFETSADLSISEDFKGSKTFLYTYLGREGVRVDNKRIPFTYFDPQTLKFETQYVDLGSIIIAATAQPGIVKRPVEPDQEDSAPVVEVEKKQLFEPIYKLASTYSYNAKAIAIGLGLLLLIGFGVRNRDFIKSFKSNEPKLIAEIGKDGVNYSRLHKLVFTLGNGHDMKSAVEHSHLSNSAKDCLYDLIEKCEGEYKQSGSSSSYRVSKKHLREFAAQVR